MPLIKFRSGTNCIVYGVSSSGKTTFILELLKQRLITNFPPRIFYFYKIFQPFMDSWNLQSGYPKITFIEGMPSDEMKNGNCICVMDDLLLEKQKRSAELFIYQSHHLNITTFFLSQNLYPRDECFRLMLLNSQYIVIMPDIRSFRQVRTLANQLFADEDKKRVLNAFKSAIKEPYGMIILNFVKNIPRELTVLTNYWSDTPSVFL